MRIAVIGFAALGLAVAGCGSSNEQRAATGGLAGAGVGALVGGPVGLVAGAAAGGAGGAVLDEGVDKKAERAVDRATGETGSATRATGMGSGASADGISNEDMRRAQQALRDQGLYNGAIDGIAGPRTQAALREFQQREGLQQTATLDQATRDRLRMAGAAGTSSGSGAGASRTQ